ncbi:MAG: NAD(P)-dependent oxidoreductase [Pedobacter sp.]
MNNTESSPHFETGYDIIHFEALGPEAAHIEEETVKAIQQNMLPENHTYLITPDNVQTFVENNPEASLPDIITTKTHSLLPDSYINSGTKSIVTRSAGYDHFEQLKYKANITSLKEYCVNAVSQTAMKFIYATAGMLNHYEMNSATFERMHSRTFLELGRHRLLTVFGVGKIGKCIHDLAEANGLTVRGVDIRHEQLNCLYNCTVQFISKEEAIATSDIIVNAMNLTKDRESLFYNIGYFSEEYLSKAEKDLIFINVTRGEIAQEDILLRLYDSGKIIGIGVDVFSNESEFARALNDDDCDRNDFPAARELIRRSVNRSANIYVQPHQAFNSDIAVKAKAAEAIKHVISWYRNNGRNFDDQLPYY